MYEYLKPFVNPPEKKDSKIINWFYSISDDEILKFEKYAGLSLPSELRQFYKEIGYGSLKVPKNAPEDYVFSDSNLIYAPSMMVDILKNQGDIYMLSDIYEDFMNPGDIPVFEIGDSSRFMMMKPQSDQPNAVWYLGSEKIEDSFSDFIYKLYHDHPAYFSRNW